MNKELKALKRIRKLLEDKYGLLIYVNDLDIIETALKKVERIEKSYRQATEMKCAMEKHIIKQDKILRIIKEKVMPLVSLDYQPERKGKEYRVYDSELYQYTDLFKEQYDLLKEYFK